MQYFHVNTTRRCVCVCVFDSDLNPSLGRAVNYQSLACPQLLLRMPAEAMCLHLNLTSLSVPFVTKSQVSHVTHLTDVIMFKQGQQTNITVAFNSFKERHVAIARVQLHVVVKNVGSCSAAEQQVDQLLVNTDC